MVELQSLLNPDLGSKATAGSVVGVAVLYFLLVLPGIGLC